MYDEEKYPSMNLVQCSKDGDVESVSRILHSGTYTQKELNRALLDSAGGAHLDIVIMLLDHGANVKRLRTSRKRMAIITLALYPIMRERLLASVGHDMADEMMGSAYPDNTIFIFNWVKDNAELVSEWNEETCIDAAETGHLAVLQWLRENGCPWDANTCASAACGGRLEVLQWARENGCPWNEETCALAALNGFLDVLQWARANGCPWDEQTCANAAEYGHLDVLQWAHDNGCPWTERAFSNAA